MDPTQVDPNMASDRQPGGATRADLVLAARARLLGYSADHPLEDVLEYTLDEAEALTGSCIGFFHFVEADGENLTLQNWSSRTKADFCTAEGKGQHYPVTQAGVWVDCVAMKAPVIHNDYASLEHRRGTPEGHAEVVRELVVPVMREGRVTAILGVGNKPTDYDEADVAAVSEIADLAWDISGRLRAERERRESEERYRTLVENANDAVYMHEALADGPGRFLEANPKATEMLGYTRAEFLAMDVSAIDPPGFAPRAAEIMSELVKNRRCRFETEHVAKDGHLVPVEISASLFDYRDRTTVLSVVRDVTERRMAEQARRDSDARYRAVVEGTNDGVAITDGEGHLLYTNAVFAGMLGYTCGQLLTMRAQDVIVEKDRRAIGDRIRRRVSGTSDEPTRYETELLRSDGTRVSVDVSASVITYHGEPTSLFVTRDISARKAAERALAESEARYRDMVGALTEGVVLQREDGAIAAWNQAAVRIFGVSAEEAVGSSNFDPRWSICAEDGTPMDPGDFPSGEVIETGRPVEDLVLGVTTPEGRLSWVSVNIRALSRDPHSGRYSVVGSVADITERRRAETDLARLNNELETIVAERTARLIETVNRLEEANETKTRFIRSMSHELRTPMNSVLGFAAVLMSETPGALNEEQRRQIAMILGSGQHLMSLIDDMLDLSKIETGTMRVHPGPVDIEELVHRLVRGLKPAAAVKELALELTTEPCPPMVSDESKIGRILLNLLDNAITYTESGGVTVTCFPRGSGYVAVTVGDTGPGMSEVERERAFGEFTQSLARPEDRPRGTGLGLAISRNLAELLGGSLELDSVPGAGSTFTLTVPVELSEEVGVDRPS